ncbi:Phosphatidylinositol-4-phosphate 5-kinase [Mortierella sp. GBA30]|nr:Phosphatidylinositol-4-phosphate 5-kinase [Mortierella sp. GBA30]
MDTASANGNGYGHHYPHHDDDHDYDYPLPGTTIDPNIMRTQRNLANGFYNDLLEEDSQGDGFVYSTTAITAHQLKAGLQTVSEGTQTTLTESPTLSHSVQHQPSSLTTSSFTPPSLPTWPSGTVARFQSSPEPKHSLHSSQEHFARRTLMQQHSNSSPSSAASAVSASPSPSPSPSLIQTPMTPPRISSLAKGQNLQMKSTQHSPPPSPPQPAPIDSSFVPRFSPRFPQPHHQHQQQANVNGASHGYSNSNGYSIGGIYAHDQEQQYLDPKTFALEPSPTLSTTESFPASLASKSTSASSPASSISVPVGATVQPSPVDLALAALSASSPRPSTSTTSSITSSINRPRPSSYAPTKVTDVSSTLANMTTLATLPIPPPSTGTTSASLYSASMVAEPTPGSKSSQSQDTEERRSVEHKQQQPQQQSRASAPSEPDSQPLPDAAPTVSPSMSIMPIEASAGGAVGAGGGYQGSPKSASPSSFNPPTRASTMDYRKIQSGSVLFGDTPSSSSGSKSHQQQQQHQHQQQLDPQAESSARPRRNKVYRRNTYSADLATTSFHRSDDEMEMDEMEEARRRMDALKKSSSRRMSKRKKDDDNDRVLIGTRIGEDHVNYVLMYNMLTGIRVSVSRCQAKPQRALVDEDFTSAHKLAFDITGNELTPSSKYDFKFKDYAPWVFRHLREDFHIDASDYLVSLTSKYILSELGSPGKSGSFFYFSQDYRFIIKTIHHAEHKFMRKILKDYFNHVKQNPHTLLCRFFGLHRVKLPHGKKIHFVVMGNVFPPNRDIHETYDLKGSTLGRAISDEELNNNPRATQKDLNWVNRNRKLELGPEKRHLFVEQTKRDVELLARLNIMDYSLLIGIHDIERGNKDNIRDNTLKVFHPDTSKQLVREPSRRDKRESKVNALRMAVKVSDPVALGPSTLPSDSFSERRHCIFYADDGGLLSTNEQNDRGQDLYYLGIIDILTPYNYVKKIEHYWKSMSQDKHAISAVNPKEYAQRFLSFMIHALKVNRDVLPVLDQKSHPHSE